MNIAQVMPIVSGFLMNPKEGVLNLEKNIIPLWKSLEQNAGGELAFIIRKNDDTGTISVALYKVADGSAMSFWKAYSLPQLVDEFKNIKNLPTEDGTISADDQPGTGAAGTATIGAAAANGTAEQRI